MTAATVRSVRGRPRSKRQMDEHWPGSRAPGSTAPLGLFVPIARVPPFEREVTVMRAWFTGQAHGRAAG
jgi:hypothetical protein